MIEDTIDLLVRDLTQVGSIPKSEARRRIQELLFQQQQTTEKEVKAIERACFRDVIVEIEELLAHYRQLL